MSLDFGIASFDYDVLLVRNVEYVTLITNKSDFKNVSEDTLLKFPKEHIAELKSSEGFFEN